MSEEPPKSESIEENIVVEKKLEEVEKDTPSSLTLPEDDKNEQKVEENSDEKISENVELENEPKNTNSSPEKPKSDVDDDSTGNDEKKSEISEEIENIPSKKEPELSKLEGSVEEDEKTSESPQKDEKLPQEEDKSTQEEVTPEKIQSQLPKTLSVEPKKSPPKTSVKRVQEIKRRDGFETPDTPPEKEQKKNFVEKKKKPRRHTSAGGGVQKRKKKIRKDEWMLPFKSIDMQYRIGSGGYGTVFRGKLKVGIGYVDVALKEMKKNQNRYDGVKAEVKLMEEVHLHPNILNCYGATFDPKSGNHYLITQFCNNGDLCSFYKKNIIEPSKKLKYLIHLAKAFKFLHSKGIIHRDLKPENILISDSHDVLLCDFGVSKHKDRMSGTLIGSVEYLPPEYLDDKLEIVPTKIDIYSFGIIIYELFEEVKPFSEYLVSNQQNHFHLLYLINQEDKRPNVTKMKSNMPSGLKKLMVECWDRNVKKRPNDFVEILKRLQKIYKDEKKKRRESRAKIKKDKKEGKKKEKKKEKDEEQEKNEEEEKK